MSVAPFKRYLFENRIAQKDVASETGIHYSEISRIASGMDPGETRAQAIVEVLRRNHPDLTASQLGWPQYDQPVQDAA